MTLPLVRGYPIIFSVSQRAINKQLSRLIDSGKIGDHWTAHDKGWKLDAHMGAPYIDFDESFAQDIRLNFPVASGTVQWATIGDDEQIVWTSYKLDGVVFSFLSPTQLLTADESGAADEYSDAKLSAASLFLELDSPELRTVVQTSKAIDTQLPDGIKAPFATRVQDYLRSLAKKDPDAFIISTSLVSPGAQGGAGTGGCLAPTTAHYSVFEDFDRSQPEGSPKRSARSTVNWLLETAHMSRSDSPGAGKLDSNPLPDGADGVMIIAGDAIHDCVLFPPVDAYFRNMANRGWPGDMNLYPNGDHMQLDAHLKRTVTKEVKVGPVPVSKATVTVDVRWTTKFRFTVEDGKLSLQASSTKPSVNESGDSSILGIPVPSFANDALLDLANAITGKPGFSLPALGAISTGYIGRVRVPGGQRFNLRSASMKGGHLYLGVTLTPYTWVDPNQEGSLRSKSGGETLRLVFHNNTQLTLKRYWISWDGKLMPYGEIGPGTSVNETGAKQYWSIHDSEGHCMAVYRCDFPEPNGTVEIPLDHATRLPPDQEKQLRSFTNGEVVHLKVHNQTGHGLKIYWIGWDGKAEHYNDLARGGTYSVDTGLRQYWSVHDEQDRCIAVYRLDFPGKDNIVDIVVR